MRNSSSASTIATISTHKSLKRPMSTSIIPSLSLDSRPSVSLKRTSTPQQLFIPKRPSSTSQSALASSQSQFALNLLNRTSNQNSSQNSIRSLDHSPLLIRDFGFKLNDPRHLGLAQRLSNRPTPNDSCRSEDLAIGSSRTSYWNICASPTGPDGTFESELERDQEEAEQSIEIDKLINNNQEYSLSSTATPFGSACASTSTSSSPTTAINLNEIGVHQILTKLSSKYDNLYVSLYDFQAEGESEMNLTRGEIVKVLEIICDGWVVAKKTRLEIDEEGKLFNGEHSRHISIDDLTHFELPNDENSDDLFLTGLCPENFLCKIS